MSRARSEGFEIRTTLMWSSAQVMRQIAVNSQPEVQIPILGADDKAEIDYCIREPSKKRRLRNSNHLDLLLKRARNKVFRRAEKINAKTSVMRRYIQTEGYPEVARQTTLKREAGSVLVFRELRNRRGILAEKHEDNLVVPFRLPFGPAFVGEQQDLVCALPTEYRKTCIAPTKRARMLRKTNHLDLLVKRPRNRSDRRARESQFRLGEGFSREHAAIWREPNETQREFNRNAGISQVETNHLATSKQAQNG
ncbi:hypothetical protein DFH09DRAFT_1067470 [Mycena vulgaris]|nr:hypothetical protein DFH09DRAFT_1067470 [Mycena vulgaris]